MPNWQFAGSLATFGVLEKTAKLPFDSGDGNSVAQRVMRFLCLLQLNPGKKGPVLMLMNSWLKSFRSLCEVKNPAKRMRRWSVKRRNAGSISQNPAEVLEPRSLLTTFTVNSLADTPDANPGDGFAVDANGETSLRAALGEANALAGADIIEFNDGSGVGVNFHNATPDIITLAGTQLTISSDLIIRGPGADLLTVSGNSITRVFEIGTGDHDVEFESLTIADGRTTGSNGPGKNGAGVRNRSSGVVEITDTVFTGNRTAFRGGGVYHETGTLVVSNSEFDRNVAIRDGGAMAIDSNARIEFSTINSNTANSSGGLDLGTAATVVITDSTISANRGIFSVIVANGGDAGGIGNHGQLTILNSTVSGNSARVDGGGIANYSGVSTVVNTTLTGNTTASGGTGAGISRIGGTVNLRNSIVVGNTRQGIDLNVSGTVNASSSITTGTVTDILDPVLSDNGGATLTHALVTGSSAIDAGDNSLATDDGTATGNALTTDQRGTGFTRVINGTVDIGAVEARLAVNLSVSSSAGTEAGTTEITVTATAIAAVSGIQTVDLAVSGTGITNDDYTLANTTITISDGGTTGSVTFTIQDDTTLEPTETATLTISNPSSGISLGATSTQDVTITDNDTASLSVNNVIGVEGTGLRFKVVLDNDVQGPFDVDFDFINGSAVGGTDFDNTPVTLNFVGDAGEKHFVVVSTTDDDVGMELTEDFTVTLTSSNMLVDDSATGTGTIDDADVPLPDQASGLMAVNIDGVRPTLQWDTATNATSYSVYILNFATGVVANESYIFGTDFTPDTDLPAGSYRFLVKSVNGAGNGGWSEPFDFTLGMPAAAPSAPTGLTSTNTETLRPTLQWSNTDGATSYMLYFQNQAGDVIAHLPNVMTNEYVQPADLPEGGYRFLVKATNAGGSSGWSAPHDFTVGTPDAPPEAPVGLAAIDTDTPQPTLQWAASAGASSYAIYFQNLAGGVVFQASDLSTTSFAQTTDLPDGNYRFLVKAANAGGSSSWSAPHDFTIGSPAASPDAPTGLTAIDTATPQPTLQWAASTGATSYAIYFHRLGGDVISQASNLTATSFIQTSDLPDGSYRFLVKATNPGGSSAWSAPFDFTLGQIGMSQFAPADEQQDESMISLMDGVLEEIAISGL